MSTVKKDEQSNQPMPSQTQKDSTVEFAQELTKEAKITKTTQDRIYDLLTKVSIP